jgi:hypothetical protein
MEERLQLAHWEIFFLEHFQPILEDKGELLPKEQVELTPLAISFLR